MRRVSVVGVSGGGKTTLARELAARLDGTNLYRWDPEKSIIRWSWTTYDKVSERYESSMTDNRYAHIDFVRLRSHAESADWLATL